MSDSTLYRRMPVLGLCLALSACLGGGGGGGSGAAKPQRTAANERPTITGTPPSSVREGETYVFEPEAGDPDGDTLEFRIAGKPGWAEFDARTGRMSGVPTSADVGTYQGIMISVTDGMLVTPLPAFDVDVARAAATSGEPEGEVLAGETYSFEPEVEEGDGDGDGDLTFSVENLPGWARFDSETGRIEGTPGEGDVGQFTDIQIIVNDGEASRRLAPFSISVVGVASGSVTLSWTPPTENTDGTPLLDLAGYTVYWGRGRGKYGKSVDLEAGITSYVVENLTPGMWFFATRAYNSDGVYSDYSNEASKPIQ